MFLNIILVLLFWQKPHNWKNGGGEKSVDSGRHTMTTNSTNSYSRQETLHNLPPHSSSSSASNGDLAGSRLPPRTRPVVALPPSKLEPVIDVESTAVYEDAYDEVVECRTGDRSESKRAEATPVDGDYTSDSLRATQSREMPGNRPPMWRQRSREAKCDAHCRGCRKGQADHGRNADERPKNPRHRSSAASDIRLLPSKLSFKSTRHHHHRSDTYGTTHSRSARVVYNSLDSGSTGSSRRYESRYTTSTDYGDTHCSDYPDCSQMNPDDIFYPPGGSFQPYEAKYEPGCYKSSSMSGFHRPKHPPSPPVRDEPIKPDSHLPRKAADEEEEEENCCSSHQRFIRSSSMQNLSHYEEDWERSGIRKRLARSASAHRRKDPDESKSRLHHQYRLHACSSASSLGNENEANSKSRGRSHRKTDTDASSLGRSDSLHYDSNHNLSRSKSKQESRKISNYSSSDFAISNRYGSSKQPSTCPSDASARSRDSASTSAGRQVCISSVWIFSFYWVNFKSYPN